MDKEFWQTYFATLGNALQRLHEALIYYTDPKKIYRDAAIYRFKYCIELYLNVLKMILAYEKIQTQSPRDLLEKSFQYKLINDDKIWLNIMYDRSRASYLYRENEVEEVFLNIINYYPIMQKNYKQLKNIFSRLNYI